MRTPTVLLTVAALSFTSAADALAKTTSRLRPAGPDRVKSVIRDCVSDEHLDRRYPVRTLRRTLRHLPRDVAQYTDCERVVRREIRRRS